MKCFPPPPFQIERFVLSINMTAAQEILGSDFWKEMVKDFDRYQIEE